MRRKSITVHIPVSYRNRRAICNEEFFELPTNPPMNAKYKACVACWGATIKEKRKK